MSTPVTFTQVRDGVTTTHSTNIDAYDSSLNQVTLAVAPPGGTDSTCASPRWISPPPAGRLQPLVQIEAADPGAWGNTLQVRISHTSLGRAQVVSLSESVPLSGDFDVVRLTTVSGFYAGAIVEFDLGSSGAAGDRLYHRCSACRAAPS